MVQKPGGPVPCRFPSVLFSCNLPGGFCLGDAIFSLAGLSAWSAGSSGLHSPPTRRFFCLYLPRRWAGVFPATGWPVGANGSRP